MYLQSYTVILNKGARVAVVIFLGYGHDVLSSILDETVCSSHWNLANGMNPTISPPVMKKIVKHTSLFKLGKATSLEEKLLIQFCKTLPNHFVPHSTRVESLGWVPLSYGLVPHLSKKLSKFPL